MLCNAYLVVIGNDRQVEMSPNEFGKGSSHYFIGEVAPVTIDSTTTFSTVCLYCTTTV